MWHFDPENFVKNRRFYHTEDEINQESLLFLQDTADKTLIKLMKKAQ